MYKKLATCLDLMKKYEWLLDSYVLDFYVEDHWSKLPKSWRQHLEDVPIENLCSLLRTEDIDSTCTRVLWPLELLALRQIIRFLSIQRTPTKELDVAEPACPLLEHPKLKHMFMKCVKPKKAHEIRRMAAICSQSCHQASISYVVDFGAGVGHLARILGYGYGINVCCFEMQPDLNKQAQMIDTKLENIAAKHLDSSEIVKCKQPVHLTQRLSHDTKPEQFIESIREAFRLPNENFCFGIIGLHPCGDLGATLMRMFVSCEQAKFLNIVGCCYQKMSTQATHPQMKLQGYPLSSRLQRCLDSCQLSYEAREIACHAIELYYDRLQAGQYEYLKIHSLRAAAERIIAQQLPDLRHSALRNVKYSFGMTFNDYFKKATESTKFALLQAENLDQIERDLYDWRRIVCFYTLRLMLAPLVESIILYDRTVFLIENDNKTECFRKFSDNDLIIVKKDPRRPGNVIFDMTQELNILQKQGHEKDSYMVTENNLLLENKLQSRLSEAMRSTLKKMNMCITVDGKVSRLLITQMLRNLMSSLTKTGGSDNQRIDMFNCVASHLHTLERANGNLTTNVRMPSDEKRSNCHIITYFCSHLVNLKTLLTANFKEF